MHFIPQNALVWPSAMKVRQSAPVPQGIAAVQLLQSTRPAFAAQTPVATVQNWLTAHDELSRQKTAEEILDSLARYLQRTSGGGH